MSFAKLRTSVEAFMGPHWYLLGIGLALIAAGWGFASQALIIYSREFFIDAAVYVFLQVAGWVVVIEWLRLAGYLTVSNGN